MAGVCGTHAAGRCSSASHRLRRDHDGVVRVVGGGGVVVACRDRRCDEQLERVRRLRERRAAPDDGWRARARGVQRLGAGFLQIALGDGRAKGGALGEDISGPDAPVQLVHQRDAAHRRRAEHVDRAVGARCERCLARERQAPLVAIDDAVTGELLRVALGNPLRVVPSCVLPRCVRVRVPPSAASIRARKVARALRRYDHASADGRVELRPW
mmetsp:Transcript_21772/g.67513  ORF Transcript_21772/g.67513 Transcript_21772/m.67513 type:complete len:213 (-) Transcript_21772:30-668(-)